MTDQRTADEVQRDVERRRAELRGTVDEIQHRLTPGQLFDRAVDYFWEEPRAGGQSRLTRAIVQNPLPVLVIGAGLAWLAIAATQERPRRGRRIHRGYREAYLDDDLYDDYPEEGYADEPGLGPLSSMRSSTMAGDGPGPSVMSASSLIGDKVTNHQNESLGKIEDIMIDMGSGRVAYAVLSFGGVAGIGDKYFAVPWQALRLDAPNKQFILNVTKERLKEAEGFDKNNWPAMADPTWARTTHGFYEARPYWE
ncbi:MAG TPA: PRC-barrel domain-containing protein [Geminicoccaceae bacterium]